MGPFTSNPQVAWPGGKTFAFTIFDDPDFQTPARASAVYDLLADLGIKTTKGIWPGHPGIPPDKQWWTCLDPEYLKWTQSIQARGFEIGWHGASPQTSLREETRTGLERFRELFGHPPWTSSQHYDCLENVYWGNARLSGPAHRLLYRLLAPRQRNLFAGHIPGDPRYWSDLCRHQVKYVRNFVFSNINTLAMCPFMPYHDPDRPDVNYWYASSEGANVDSFNRTVSEAHQDRLEAEGGACIMYAHFAYRFAQDGVLNPRFRSLMERLSRKNGWFVPVSTLLDFLASTQPSTVLSHRQRRVLEHRWLMHKIRFGSA